MIYTILYVDDEPALLDLGKKFLESKGEFVVDTQLSAIDSLEILKTRSYDAIISDYLMPDMDGIRFLKEVRATYGDLPFILFTGRGREEVVIEAINNGVDFYLQKGGQQKALFSELAHKIKKAIERRQAELTISALINAPPDVSLLLDTSGKVLGLNKAATIRFQKTREDLIGTDGYSLLFQEPAGMPKEKIQALITSHEPWTVTDAYMGRLYETHMYPVTDYGSEVTAVAVYSRDVTEAQRSREELQATYEQLSAQDEELRGQFEALLQGEEQIRESEEKYRTLVEHTEDGVFIAQDGMLLFTNGVFSAMTGYNAEEIIGLPFSRIVAPEHREMVLSRHSERLSGVSLLPETYEFSLLHKDGTTRIHIRIRVGAGKYRGSPATIGTLHDVTQERRRDAALAESEELHRKMISAIPDVIVRVDLDGNIVYINDQGVSMSGVTDPSELVGTSMFSFFAPESLPVAIENAKLMFERPLGPIEYVFMAKNGRRVTLEVNGDVLRTPEGTPYGMIFICRDITDRKRAELALRESEATHRNIIENMQDVFYRTNREGIITMISPYGARLVGYDSPAEIIGKVPAKEFYADPEERDAFIEYLMREKVVTGYPLTLKDRAGNLHYATASSRLLSDDSGEMNGIEGILHDITPLRQTERALRQANRQITLMTSITRHDIMNQLMVLKGLQELSRDFIDAREQLLELITKEQHVTGIIGQQIGFTTFFEDIGVKDPFWQDPALLTRKAQESLPFRNIRLETDLTGIEILADTLFEKVFYNLFDNALRYGGEAMTLIRVTAKESNTGLTLVVEDDGTGIPVEDKTQVFTRGFGKNTGLGLFLAGEILSITGITIKETGKPGTGARFEMAIPKGTYRSKGG